MDELWCSLCKIFNLWCRREGNPFNTTIIPSPPASSPSLPPSIAPSPHIAPTKRANGPSASQLPQFGREVHNSTTKSVSWIAIAGLLAVVLLALGLCALMFKCCKRRKLKEKTMKKYEMGAFGALGHKQDQSLSMPHYQVDRGKFTLSICYLSMLVAIVRFFELLSPFYFNK